MMGTKSCTVLFFSTTSHWVFTMLLIINLKKKIDNWFTRFHQRRSFVTFMSTAAASQYCGTLAAQHAGNQTQWVSLVKQSRGRSRDPGSVFGRIITNRKSLQAGRRRPLPSFVYRRVWFERPVIKLHNGLLLQNPFSAHFRGSYVS